MINMRNAQKTPGSNMFPGVFAFLVIWVISIGELLCTNVIF